MDPPKEYLTRIHNDVFVRDFLYALYSLDKADKKKRKSLLLNARPEQLEYTILTLHYLVTKAIPVLEEPHGKIIHASKRVPHMVKCFAEVKDANALIRGSKLGKITALQKVNTFHHLFWLLFNNPKKS